MLITHCVVENPREPGGLPPMGSHRVGHDWSDLAAAAVANDSEPLSLFVCIFHV